MGSYLVLIHTSSYKVEQNAKVDGTRRGVQTSTRLTEKQECSDIRPSSLVAVVVRAVPAAADAPCVVMRLASPTVQQGRLKGQLTERSRYRRDEQHSTTARSVRTNSCYAAKMFVNGSCEHTVLRVEVEAKCCQQHLLHAASSGVRWGLITGSQVVQCFWKC